MFSFYRADDRTPEQIKTAQGFRPRITLPVNDARLLLRKCYEWGAHGHKSFENAPDWLNNMFKNKVNIKDFASTIKSKVDHETVWISTDITVECGGRPKKYRYKIEYDNLCVSDKIDGFLQANDINNFKVWVNPKIVTDGPSLDYASTIAIACVGYEVSFLTPIPYSNIKQWQEAEEKDTWHDMP
ncbi:hypothetical protein AGMMS50229_06570 [Campylobacterota bacterium]|nr:hypothetical protein AGMMS50229_06570 [Campylobacterota bacterium]